MNVNTSVMTLTANMVATMGTQQKLDYIWACEQQLAAFGDDVQVRYSMDVMNQCIALEKLNLS